jgi:hypothetical protein
LAAGGILLLGACERKAGQEAANPPAAAADPAPVEPAPPKEAPVPSGNKPPVAEAVPGKPGFVLSPFDGKVIDVREIPAGTLVADPSYPADEKRYFRVPELPVAPAKPPGLLDPARLIDPAARKPAGETVAEP